MKHLYFSLILISGLITLGFGFCWFSGVPIQKITVKGNLDLIDSTRLKPLLYPFLRKNLFTLSLNKIRSALQVLPEVENVTIYRQWPNHLEVRLFSKEPVARWGIRGSYISAYGDTFISSAKPFSNLQLPVFIGSNENIIKMLAYTQQMNRILSPLNMRIKVLAFDAMQSWTIELTNGIKIKLGDEKVLMRLKRWVLVYPKIMKSHHVSIPKTIDLRYEHGMAIKWG